MDTVEDIPRTFTVRFLVEFPTELLVPAILEETETKAIEALVTAALSQYGAVVRRVFFPHKVELRRTRKELRRRAGDHV